jgi:hypothetical protein
LPDEINRLTTRFEMASRSAASSRVISLPTFVLFLTDCRELWPDDDSGTGDDR